MSTCSEGYTTRLKLPHWAERSDIYVHFHTTEPSLIAWHTGRMKWLSWQSWSLEIKDVGRFTSRNCNTGRMKLKFQVFVKLVSCQSKRTAQCAPVRNKIIILIYTYWTLITVVHSHHKFTAIHKRTAVKGTPQLKKHSLIIIHNY